MDVPEITPLTSLESTPWKPGDNTLTQVKYIDFLPSYEAFFQDILLKNQLCVLGPHVTSNWTSRKHWVLPDGSPHFEYLLEQFGEHVAPVADCNAEEFCAHPKTEMTIKDYLTYWQSYRFQGHCLDTQCLYLKDWHFVRDCPGYHAYDVPSVLCSDWMNEFWDVRSDQGKTDDYRFVYMGPKHSWTPFHADVLHSYSWSANICGKKKWIFYPPGAERNLKDKHGQLVFDVRSPDLQDLHKYPDASAVADAAITVIQNPGEIIFVPSGWHHQVFNLEDTISINHNWMNGCSAHLTWEHIKGRLGTVEREIEDCRSMEGWHQQCQVILKADSGIDYVSFYNFMATIAVHRMIVLDLYLAENGTDGVHNISYTFKHRPSSSSGWRHGKDTSDIDGTLVLSVGSVYAHEASIRCSKGENTKLSPNCLDRIPESDHIGTGFTYLCLLTSVVVDASTDATAGKICQSNRGKEKNNRSSCQQAVQEHQTCPHWAHCGPNLALFDLCRVLEIVRNMMEHAEFKVIMEDAGILEQFHIPPSEMIVQADSIRRHMTCLYKEMYDMSL